MPVMEKPMNAPQILFADDDPSSQQMVQTALKAANLKVLLASSGAEALEVWRNNPLDLIILDVMMPDMSGFEVCQYIRRVSPVPIMMLTGMSREQDILQGFESGSDDYIFKPFRPKELIARIHAILQRTSRSVTQTTGRLMYGDLELDIDAQRALRRGEPIQVTPLEFQLLQYMIQRVGVALSKEELFQNVWGYTMPSGGMNLIEVAVRRLREKVEEDPSHPAYIQTVRGVGYRFGA